MTPDRRSRQARRAAIRRRRLAAIASLALIVAAVVIFIAGTGGEGTKSDPAPPRYVRIELGGGTLVKRRVGQLRRPAEQAEAIASIPAKRTVHQGKATIDYEVDRAAATAALRRAVSRGGGTVTVPERPVAASIAVPMIGQVLQDDCEATALSMVLGYSGHPVSQLTLQKQVAHSPPLDPTVGADGSEVWGDPSEGFVGRADGGGPAGGFGVYQKPIRSLARRHGLAMRELTSSPPSAVYAALLAGHPVLAWVALSEGPYASWVSQAGKPIKINYGEHAVVLTGVEGEGVHVNDPLSGERLVWSKQQFEQMWAGLGHRALAA
ncbi:MAG: C39 family peptidase [Solirubrobacterales bacterium]